MTSWNITKIEKLNDSVIRTKFKIINPKKISRFKTKSIALIEANIAYLLRLKNPVKTTQKLKIIDNRDAYTVLYSISNILKLDPQTEFTQNE